MTDKTAYLILFHAWFMFALVTGSLVAYFVMFVTMVNALIFMIIE